MMKRWVSLVILLLIALPSALHAVEMGGFEGGASKPRMGIIHIQTETVGKILFSHKIHSFSCTRCHSKIFIKKKNSNHASMKDMEDGKSCGACHNGKIAFSVRDDCVNCHAGDIALQDKTVGNITFPHSVHIEALGGCDSCHPDLFKPEHGANKKATMKDMEKGASCGACHDGSAAFSVKGDCTTCHTNATEIT